MHIDAHSGPALQNILEIRPEGKFGERKSADNSYITIRVQTKVGEGPTIFDICLCAANRAESVGPPWAQDWLAGGPPPRPLSRSTSQ